MLAQPEFQSLFSRCLFLSFSLKHLLSDRAKRGRKSSHEDAFPGNLAIAGGSRGALYRAYTTFSPQPRLVSHPGPLFVVSLLFFFFPPFFLRSPFVQSFRNITPSPLSALSRQIPSTLRPPFKPAAFSPTKQAERRRSDASLDFAAYGMTK